MSELQSFFAPISIGEAYDKITILRIKRRMIDNPQKLENIVRELTALERSVEQHVGTLSRDVEQLVDKLQSINESLWNVEDEIRECERMQDFGAKFIALARAVYVTNDERAEVKKFLNVALGSAFVEEKSYQEYRQTTV